MKNILSIMRRDLSSYFTTPIGYIFMMVFVTISVGLYITAFFGFPIADMRPYFDNLPLLLCIFIPAVTMRVWAEERKENTWEMLLTFPMQARELVLGKFFAALAFFGLTLASTVTVPAMLFALGRPDKGAIFSGYLGTLMLGAFFLALGVFFSGFFKDQIVAFVVTLLVCFLFFLLGTDFMASYIDDKWAGLGSLLSALLGFFKHFSAFTRGIIDIADVLYFAGWTVLFLWLNILYIDGRNRPGAKTIFGTAVAICVAIGLLLNWLLVGQSLVRFDMTEDKIHTMSPASARLLAKLDTPVQIKLYITPQDKMPTQMKDLERSIVDKLEELRIASKGKLEYKTVYFEVANVIADAKEKDEKKAKTEEEAIEKRMLDKGVEPFSVQVRESDQVTNKLVYSSLGVAYKDKAEEIVPQIMPQIVPELEYRLVSTIHKLTREKAPVVALVAPKDALNIDPQMKRMLQQMGQQVPESEDPYVYLQQLLQYEKYDVKRVELSKDDPLPEGYDTLAVVNPRNLSDRQRWEIARALRSGKSVVMAVQNYEWDYRPTREGTSVSRRDEKPNVNPLLDYYGLGVAEDALMDVNSVPMTMSSGSLADLLGGGQTINQPTHVLVNSTSMAQDVAITNRLESVFYLWGSPLKIDEEKLKKLNLTAKVVMRSSDRAWTRSGSLGAAPDMFDEPANAERKAYPLMAVVEGQFPDVFEGKPRPAWPKPEQMPGQPPMPQDDTPEKDAPAVEAKPGKLILLGCSEMFRKNFLQAGNLDLFLNSVDAVSLTEDLVDIRGRKPIDRAIDRPTDGQKNAWRLANYGLANLIIAGIGVSFFSLRRRSRNAYTVAQVRKNEN